MTQPCRYVAGFNKGGTLKRTLGAGPRREGGDASSSRRSTGHATYEAITLERGVTHDPEFEQWANACVTGSSKDLRKDIIIEVYNEAGKLTIAYKVYRCWVSEYQALPELDASDNAVAIQTLKLGNEG